MSQQTEKANKVLAEMRRALGHFPHCSDYIAEWTYKLAPAQQRLRIVHSDPAEAKQFIVSIMPLVFAVDGITSKNRDCRLNENQTFVAKQVYDRNNIFDAAFHFGDLQPAVDMLKETAFVTSDMRITELLEAGLTEEVIDEYLAQRCFDKQMPERTRLKQIMSDLHQACVCYLHRGFSPNYLATKKPPSQVWTKAVNTTFLRNAELLVYQYGGVQPVIPGTSKWHPASIGCDALTEFLERINCTTTHEGYVRIKFDAFIQLYVNRPKHEVYWLEPEVRYYEHQRSNRKDNPYLSNYIEQQRVSFENAKMLHFDGLGDSTAVCRFDIPITVNAMLAIGKDKMAGFVLVMYMNLLVESQRDVWNGYCMRENFFDLIAPFGAKNPDYEEARRQMKDINVFGYDYILIPIGHSYGFWSLAIAEFQSSHVMKLHYYGDIPVNQVDVLEVLESFFLHEYELHVGEAEKDSNNNMPAFEPLECTKHSTLNMDAGLRPFYSRGRMESGLLVCEYAIRYVRKRKFELIPDCYDRLAEKIFHEIWNCRLIDQRRLIVGIRNRTEYNRSRKVIGTDRIDPYDAHAIDYDEYVERNFMFQSEDLFYNIFE